MGQRAAIAQLPGRGLRGPGRGLPLIAAGRNQAILNRLGAAATVVLGGPDDRAALAQAAGGSGPGTIPLAEITGAIPQLMSVAVTGDLPIDIDEIPLAEVEDAWHHRDGGRRIVFRP